MSRELKLRYFCSKDKRFVYSDNFPGFGGFFSYFENQKNPLQQYTGFNDKDGNKIYEGDIIKTLGGMAPDFNIIISWCGSWFPHLKVNSYNKIIGNIYENPELLKEINNE